MSVVDKVIAIFLIVFIHVTFYLVHSTGQRQDDDTGTRTSVHNLNASPLARTDTRMRTGHRCRYNLNVMSFAESQFKHQQEGPLLHLCEKEREKGYL